MRTPVSRVATKLDRAARAPARLGPARLGLLRQLAVALSTPVGGALRALLGETHHRPELLAALHSSVFDPHGADVRAPLRDAARHDEIFAHRIDGPAASIGHETLVFQFLTVGLPEGDEPEHQLTAITDDLVLPLFRAAH